MGLWDSVKDAGSYLWSGVKSVGKGILGYVGDVTGYNSAGTYDPALAERVYWGGSPFVQGERINQYGGLINEGYDASRRFEAAGMGARGLELSVYDRYQQMAEGRGPSVAREMAKQGADVAQQQALQLAASARGGGGNQLLAIRQAQREGALAQQRAMATAAQLGQQEQISAIGAMGDIASRVRSGDARAQEMAAARGRDFLGARQELERSVYQGEQQRSLADQEAKNLSKAEGIRSRMDQMDRRREFFKTALSAGVSAAKMAAGGGM